MLSDARCFLCIAYICLLHVYINFFAHGNHVFLCIYMYTHMQEYTNTRTHDLHKTDYLLSVNISLFGVFCCYFYFYYYSFCYSSNHFEKVQASIHVYMRKRERQRISGCTKWHGIWIKYGSSIYDFPLSFVSLRLTNTLWKINLKKEEHTENQQQQKERNYINRQLSKKRWQLKKCF